MSYEVDKPSGISCVHDLLEAQTDHGQRGLEGDAVVYERREAKGAQRFLEVLAVAVIHEARIRGRTRCCLVYCLISGTNPKDERIWIIGNFSRPNISTLDLPHISLVWVGTGTSSGERSCAMRWTCMGGCEDPGSNSCCSGS